MDKRKKLLRIALVLAVAALVGLPCILCSELLSSRVGDALLYGGTSQLLMNIISALCAAVLLIVWNISFDEKETEASEEESEDEEICDIYEVREDVSCAADEYPELFLSREEGKKSEAPLSYTEEVERAIASQKSDYVPEKEENEEAENCEIAAFLSLDKEEKTVDIPDIYSDIPDTLPEGYEMREEEEESFAETEEMPVDEEDVQSSKRPWIKKLIIGSVAIAVPFICAFLLSENYTVYSEEGVLVHSFLGEKSYTWSDCESYEIGPSFFGFGDTLSFKLHMEDGEKIELFPSDLRGGESFYEKYDSDYAYSVAVSEKLERAGAKKKVNEKNVIENGLALREDIGEEIKKLID